MQYGVVSLHIDIIASVTDPSTDADATWSAPTIISSLGKSDISNKASAWLCVLYRVVLAVCVTQIPCYYPATPRYQQMHE
jgi:hypothetical protein